ncbi:ABC transporter ATP-binding protein [Anaerosporomusa subterranea]|uniref:ABC transporter ATP-binding protein n=1 Tax=Anaerosporomusa subterranea TaxID=1794912 RepID=A0A154BLS3_ANASB|nr:ABC transporter ATP-binding protein [Anaerosporomusa subterranea]KYZ74872.1 ABC transporter ATP-binding protein [Anaerosporomusa subterranea]
MLKIANLKASYGKIRAVHEVSLEVGQGELVTLIGANGAGKSTTLKSIVGLVQEREGEIFFKGKNISQIAPHKALDAGIALVPEGRWIFPDITVEENLRLGAFYQSKNKVQELLAEQYALFPILRERRNQKGGTLSGGEQQMLAIGRALMSQPELLLLDEPSLGLAPILVNTVFQLIKQINQRGIAVLLVEQNSTMALGIADRGYVLELGRIVLAGASTELLDNKRVQSAYLGIA